MFIFLGRLGTHPMRFLLLGTTFFSPVLGSGLPHNITTIIEYRTDRECSVVYGITL